MFLKANIQNMKVKHKKCIADFFYLLAKVAKINNFPSLTTEKLKDQRKEKLSLNSVI